MYKPRCISAPLTEQTLNFRALQSGFYLDGTDSIVTHLFTTCTHILFLWTAEARKQRTGCTYTQRENKLHYYFEMPMKGWVRPIEFKTFHTEKRQDIYIHDRWTCCSCAGICFLQLFTLFTACSSLFLQNPQVRHLCLFQKNPALLLLCLSRDPHRLTTKGRLSLLTVHTTVLSQAPAPEGWNVGQPVSSTLLLGSPAVSWTSAHFIVCSSFYYTKVTSVHTFTLTRSVLAFSSEVLITAINISFITVCPIHFNNN